MQQEKTINKQKLALIGSFLHVRTSLAVKILLETLDNSHLHRDIVHVICLPMFFNVLHARRLIVHILVMIEQIY